MTTLKRALGLLAAILATISLCISAANAQHAKNPIIHADVPDASMMRVGDTYYMSSTTMHMSPGLPIMMSKDLMNWEMLNYAFVSVQSHNKSLHPTEAAYGFFGVQRSTSGRRA
jgi:beta-xylosidase